MASESMREKLVRILGREPTLNECREFIAFHQYLHDYPNAIKMLKELFKDMRDE